MKKNDKELEETSAKLAQTVMEEIARRNASLVLFPCGCGHCGEQTIHVSHLARESPESYSRHSTVPVSYGLKPLFTPIKTCLVCGEVTWRSNL